MLYISLEDERAGICFLYLYMCYICTNILIYFFI